MSWYNGSVTSHDNSESELPHVAFARVSLFKSSTRASETRGSLAEHRIVQSDWPVEVDPTSVGFWPSQVAKSKHMKWVYKFQEYLENMYTMVKVHGTVPKKVG